jgi:hypothetical protein
MIDLDKAGEILERARKAAIDYYELTGKPLGITGEFGEYVAARILGLELADARFPGYDAVDDDGRKIQIKARSIPSTKKLGGQRLGSIRLDHDWDCVMLILLDERFEPQAIYEADRAPLEEALAKPGSRARNERGALAVTKFIALGCKVWPDSSDLNKKVMKA